MFDQLLSLKRIFRDSRIVIITNLFCRSNECRYKEGCLYIIWVIRSETAITEYQELAIYGTTLYSAPFKDTEYFVNSLLFPLYDFLFAFLNTNGAKIISMKFH